MLLLNHLLVYSRFGISVVVQYFMCFLFVAIFLMGKKELDALLKLSSRCLVTVILCGSLSGCNILVCGIFDHTHFNFAMKQRKGL